MPCDLALSVSLTSVGNLFVAFQGGMKQHLMRLGVFCVRFGIRAQAERIGPLSSFNKLILSIFKRFEGEAEARCIQTRDAERKLLGDAEAHAGTEVERKHRHGETERKYSQEEEELKRLVGVDAERIRLEEEAVKKAA